IDAYAARGARAVIDNHAPRIRRRELVGEMPSHSIEHAASRKAHEYLQIVEWFLRRTTAGAARAADAAPRVCKALRRLMGMLIVVPPTWHQQEILSVLAKLGKAGAARWRRTLRVAPHHVPRFAGRGFSKCRL